MGVRRWWDDRVVPRAIDAMMNDQATAGWRAKTCASLSGDVVELGFGSGRNLPYYGDGVRRVLAVEPADLSWEKAQPRIAEFGRPVERIGLDGARIDLPDASVDAAVTTWTLCTIPDVDAALREVRRVLKPGGALHLVEHSAAPAARVARVQRTIQPVWGRLSGGCHVTRDIPALIDRSGLRREDWKERYGLPGAINRPFGWFVTGRAVAAIGGQASDE